MMDKTDMQILRILRENARLSWKEIGEQVHMTGQAVGNRIRRLEEIGIVEKYTVSLNTTKMGLSITAFVTVLMKTANHVAFLEFVKSEETICEAHRISGDGCYMLKVHAPSTKALDTLLDGILRHGNYRLSLSIGKIPL